MSANFQEFDVTIVGGGIVGLATAHHLATHYKCRLLLLEAEPRLATHQTGRNSGVIHSGVYYPTGSNKAHLCASGREQLYRFCQEHSLMVDRCGKLILATCQKDIPHLERLYQNGLQNGLESIRMLERDEYKKIEPHAGGVAALHIPQAGIVDYRQISLTLARLIQAQGGQIRLNSRVRRIEPLSESKTNIQTDQGEYRSAFIINCGGLQADRIAAMCGLQPEVQIVPFRGEYYKVASEQSNLLNGLIYPVPDPALPFLGVHLTKKLDGSIELGPNARFSFGRHGYEGFRLSGWRDLRDSVRFPGFWKLCLQHWQTGAYEWYRSVNPRAFAAEAQRLVPVVRRKDIVRSHSGIRAQAVDRSGKLVDDFVIEQKANTIHVLNAPSPAATASLAIGAHIARLAEAKFGLPQRG